MTVRCKVRLKEVVQQDFYPEQRILRFSVEGDTDIPEQLRAMQATPSGFFELLCDKPAVLERFPIGARYYVDIAPVDGVAIAFAPSSPARPPWWRILARRRWRRASAAAA